MLQVLFQKYPLFTASVAAIAIFAAIAQRPHIANQLFPWYIWGIMFVASIPFVQACSTGEEHNKPEVWEGPFWHQLILFTLFSILGLRVINSLLKIDWTAPFGYYAKNQTSPDFIIVLSGFFLGICAIGGVSRCLLLLRTKK